jgi:mRNA-degrading endonuclease YafQ of YafQ-DinJ toxin-antitoxin module
MSWKLVRSTAFVRAARKHLQRHPDHAEDFFEALAQLGQDPYHSSLRTHKLTGVLAGSWACSVGYDLRIIFRFVEYSGKRAILLETVGTHDEVY